MTRNKVLLDRNSIIAMLEDLGDELAKRFDEPVELLVIGGACLILLGGEEIQRETGRANTYDVDIYPLNVGGLTTVLEFEPGPDAKELTKAIKVVARRNRLGSDWLNDDSYMLSGGMKGYVKIKRHECTLWAQYGMLAVYVPPWSFLLACKLFAGRDKDEEDTMYLIRKLGIASRTELQAVVDRYINFAWQGTHGVPETISKFFR